MPILTLSQRKPKGPNTLEIPIDTNLLEAGDHNGSTFYQHERFARVLRGEQTVEVTLQDGINAVLMGLAAHHSSVHPSRQRTSKALGGRYRQSG